MIDDLHAAEPTPRTEWIAIARLLRPQGRRGELLAEPLSDLPDIFQDGRAVVLTAASAAAPADAAAANASRLLEGHWSPTGKNAGRVVLKVSGCDNISAAEAIAGQQVMMRVGELPPLDADTYLVGDLIGCAFFDGERLAGDVAAVEFATGPDGRTRLEDAAPLLGIRLTGHAEESELVLVPFVRAWLERVDIGTRRIVMHLPDGLLDSAELPEDADPGANARSDASSS